ncbi:MAG: DegV family protein [Clostridiales bacterium]|nr:DegV family protein [Clostridiales bacterium]
MKKIAIVTDSNAGILPSEVEDRDIFILPMPFLIDGKEYFENVGFRSEDFYGMLESGANVSTSQPSILSVTTLWDEVLKDYETIIHIPMSSGLSSSCDTAKMLAKDYKGRVIVVDNQRISVTLKQSVLDAENMIKDGKSAGEIVDFLLESKLDSSIYIMVPTLKYLKKGGRITPAAAAIGSLLNIKPVLQIQGGKLEPYQKVMSVKQANKVMMTALKNDIEMRFKGIVNDKKLKVFIAHSNDVDSAEAFRLQIEKELSGVFIEYIDELSMSVACHIGPGSLAIACARVY